MQSMDQLSADETWDQLYPTLYPTVVVVWMSLEQEIVSCSFEVCYSPPTAGLHQLRVQVGGTDILDEPLTVEVMPRKAGQTFNIFSMPAGVAITNNGKLIVAEWGGAKTASPSHHEQRQEGQQLRKTWLGKSAV